MKLYELFGHSFEPRTWIGTTNHKWANYFGVELEIEEAVGRVDSAYWAVHEDASLRNGTEYVLSRPFGAVNLEQAIDAFYDADMRYTNGPRTSTHIHVNVSDMDVDQLRCLVIAMYTIEDALFSVVGESRKWAGYAMAMSEMDTTRLRSMMSATDTSELINAISPTRNNERYYGLNTCVRRHGTVEFRYFPGGPSKAELCSWIDLVAAVAKMARTHSLASIKALAEDQDGLYEWLQSFLPTDWFGKLMRVGGLDPMMAKFTEILAFADDSANDLVRRDTIVFLTKPLVKFIREKMLESDKAKEQFDNVVKSSMVLGWADWHHYLSAVFYADQQETLSTKRKTKTETLQEHYAEVLAAATQQAEDDFWAGDSDEPILAPVAGTTRRANPFENLASYRPVSNTLSATAQRLQAQLDAAAPLRTDEDLAVTQARDALRQVRTRPTPPRRATSPRMVRVSDTSPAPTYDWSQAALWTVDEFGTTSTEASR